MIKTRRKFINQSAKLGLAGSLLGSGLWNIEPFIKPNLKKSFGPNDTIQVGVIGTGGRGKNLMQELQNIDGIDVIAGCDILPFRLEDALQYAVPNATGTDDYRRILDNPDVDAVIISAPLYLHHEMARDALLAGKHVYCEKTMTFTVEQTKDLKKYVDESDKVFQVGYQHRYNELYHTVKNIIQSEDFGPLSHVELYWNRNGDWRRPVPDPQYERIINWRMYREYSGGLMAELTSHQINVVNWIVGSSPIKVNGFGGIDYWKDGRETFDNIHAVFQYADGLNVNCNCLTTNANMGFQFKFYGKNATIQITREESYIARLWVEPIWWRQSQYDNQETDATTAATELLKKGDPIVVYENEAGTEDAEPTGYCLAAWGDCIRENKPALVGYESGKDSALCVALANKAMQQGETVYWKDYT